MTALTDIDEWASLWDETEYPWTPRGVNRFIDCWRVPKLRLRVRCPYLLTPRHHRKRGYRKTLASVLRHVEAGRCGYDDALWLFYHIAGLRSRLDRAEGELKGMREGTERLKREYKTLQSCHAQHYADLLTEADEVARLRAKLAAWDAWEHAWVFGGDAAYPGKAGVTDPRETLDALERLALGVPEEEAGDA